MHFAWSRFFHVKFVPGSRYTARCDTNMHRIVDCSIYSPTCVLWQEARKKNFNALEMKCARKQQFVSFGVCCDKPKIDNDRANKYDNRLNKRTKDLQWTIDAITLFRMERKKEVKCARQPTSEHTAEREKNKQTFERKSA